MSESTASKTSKGASGRSMENIPILLLSKAIYDRDPVVS